MSINKKKSWKRKKVSGIEKIFLISMIFLTIILIISSNLKYDRNIGVSTQKFWQLIDYFTDRNDRISGAFFSITPIIERENEFIKDDSEVELIIKDEVRTTKINLTILELKVQTNLLVLNAVPTHNTPILNASDPLVNSTTANLTAYNQSTADADNDVVKNIFNWKLNGTSIAVLNMPFENSSYNMTGDYSGFENNATFSNSVWNATGGYDGKGAFEFDGINDWIEGNMSLTKFDSFTINTWIKSGSLPFNKYVAQIYESSTSRFYIRSDSANDLKCSFYNGITEYLTSFGQNLNDHAWKMLTCKFNGTHILTYLNGTFVAAGTTALDLSGFDPISYTIGTSSTAYFNGTIDEFTVFNRSLSAEQIYALYNNRTDLIVSQETSTGDNWSVCITPNDGTEDGLTKCSINLTVVSGPEVTIPIITPTLAYNDTNLTANATYTTDLGRTATVYFQWSVNGSNVYNDTFSDVSTSSIIVSNLSLSNYSAGDIVGVSAYADDGTINSTIKEATTIRIQWFETDQELIGYWSFNQNHRNSTHVFDLSGNNNDGVFNNTGFIDGPNGSAITFNGVNSSVEIADPNHLYSGMENLTVSFFSIKNGTNTTIYLYRDSVYGPYSFKTHNNLYTIIPWLRNDSLNNPTVDTVYFPAYKFFNSYFFVYNRTHCLQYVNCQLVAKDACLMGSVKSDSSSLYIGKDNSANNYGPFNGSIDEVKIWNKSLNSTEIAAECAGISLCGDSTCQENESVSSCPLDCITLGCKNDENTTCADLGTEDENLTGNITIGPAGISTNFTEEGITFRNITSQLTVKFPAFNNDSNGFPLTPMVLEVRYKDVYNTSSSSSTNTNRIGIKSTVATEGSYTPYRSVYIAGLSGKELNTWNKEYVLIKYSNWSRLRVLDGNYSFIFTIASAVTSTPIDYIALHKITNEQSDALEQYQRDKLFMQRYDLLRTGTIADYTWFTKNPTEPVYENTTPRGEEINRSISKRVAKGEIFPISFSVASTNLIEDVEVNLTNFSCGSTILPTSNFTIYEVIQGWSHISVDSTYSSTGLVGRSYSLMPDRIEKFGNTSIEANKTKRFWIVVNLPSTVTSCNYTGNITLYNNSALLFTVPASINVMDFTLDTPNVSMFMSASPNTSLANTYNIINDHLYQAVAEHGIPLKWPEPSSYYEPYIVNTTSTNIVDFNLSATEEALDALNSKGMVWGKYFIHVRDYSSILTQLGITTGTIYEKLSNESFVEAFTLLINKLQEIAAAKNIEFVYAVSDEPANDPNSRAITDRLLTIIKDIGAETWVTYHSTCEDNVTGEGTYIPIGTTVPGLGDLLDYQVYHLNDINSESINEHPNTFGYYTTFYSQLRNPVYNRFLQGYFPQATGAKVVYVWDYNSYTGDPYHDFDSYYSYVYPYSWPDFCLGYPSWEGEVIPTMAFEGLREGITDAKYITTLQNLIDANPGNSIALEASQYLSTRFADLPLNWTTDYANADYTHGFDHIIVKNLSLTGNESDYEVFDNIRQTIADYILQLLPVTPTTSNGGGSSVTRASPTIKKFFSSIEKGILKTVAANLKNVDKIEFRVANNLQNQQISIEETISAPKIPGGIWRSFLKIDTEEIGTNLESAKIYFNVEREWIKEKGVSHLDIGLYHLGEIWEELPTEIDHSDGKNYYYVSITDRFSYFAIGVKEEEKVEEKVAAVKEKSAEIPIIIDEGKKEEVETTEKVEPADIIQIIVWFISICLSVIGGIYFSIKIFKKHLQKPVKIKASLANIKEIISKIKTNKRLIEEKLTHLEKLFSSQKISENQYKKMKQKTLNLDSKCNQKIVKIKKRLQKIKEKVK